MNARQRQHFGLARAPFDKRVANAELWLPPSKEPIVEDLYDAVHPRQWGLLVGEPGVGKTCVLRALRHRLDADRYRLTYCHNSTLGRRDFYRQICHALGLAPKATAAAVFYAITTHVAEIAREQHHPVLLIYEAHLLRQQVAPVYITVDSVFTVTEASLLERFQVMPRFGPTAPLLRAGLIAVRVSMPAATKSSRGPKSVA